MDRKILIIGRSGSGKDTLAMALTEKFGMKQLCSTTTRPRRYDGEDSHIFVSEAEAEKLKERVAETVINGYQYFATKQQFEECDIYVIDPRGLEYLCKKAPNSPLCVVYVHAEDGVRKERAIKRADDAEEAAKVFEKRHADEDEQFSDFERNVYLSKEEKLLKKYPSADVFVTLENNGENKEDMNHFAKLVEEIAKMESPRKIYNL